jgi:hypothetical protein
VQKSAEVIAIQRIIDEMKLDIKVQREFEEEFSDNPDTPQLENVAKIS